MPLLLYVATGARHVALRALAAAAMPALMLTALFTLSRGGIAAIFLSVAVFIAFTPRPPAEAPHPAGRRRRRRHPGRRRAQPRAAAPRASTATAHDQGDELLIWTIVVCVVVGLLQAAISVALERGMRPRWTRIRGSSSLVALGAAVASSLIVALVAINAPCRVERLGRIQAAEPG